MDQCLRISQVCMLIAALQERIAPDHLKVTQINLIYILRLAGAIAMILKPYLCLYLRCSVSLPGPTRSLRLVLRWCQEGVHRELSYHCNTRSVAINFRRWLWELRRRLAGRPDCTVRQKDFLSYEEFQKLWKWNSTRSMGGKKYSSLSAAFRLFLLFLLRRKCSQINDWLESKWLIRMLFMHTTAISDYQFSYEAFCSKWIF